mgnify:CR=1 FL=1
MGKDIIPKSLVPMTINQLMRHLRNDRKIQINGSKQKNLLIEYGYYHGYKGYRFFYKRNNTIPYKDFSQLISVIEYDQKLKSVLYPIVMYLEMIMKNIVVNDVVVDLPDASFDTVYKVKMKDENSNNSLRLKRLTLRDRIHNTLSKNYATKSRGFGNNQNIMVSHFYNRGNDVPLWAIFEIISLGDFAKFCSCLNKETRKQILKSIGMISSSDTDYQLIPNILYMVKGLRNSIAHNNVIFDIRFKDRGNNKNVVRWISDETGISNIQFLYLTDYLILICVVLNKINCEVDMIIDTVEEYENCINELYKKLPINIYNKIVSTDARTKIHKLIDYLNSK